MKLSRTAFRLYARYKSQSSDLFKTIPETDLSSVGTWTKTKIAEHQEWLDDGYVRNMICAAARQRFRDAYIPESERDESHEKAIRSAELNCFTYTRMNTEFRQALADAHAQQKSESDTASGSESDTGNDNDRNGAATPSVTIRSNRRKELSRPTEDEVNILNEEWKASLQERMDKDTATELLVTELYIRAEKHLVNLKVKDEETILVMSNLLRLLAPSTAIKWSWEDKAVIKILSKVSKTDDELRGLVAKAIVQHRQSSDLCSGVRRTTQFRLTPLLDPDSRKIRELTVIIFMITDLTPNCMDGRNMFDLGDVAAHRNAILQHMLGKGLPEISFRKAVPVDMFSSGKATLAACVIRGVLSLVRTTSQARTTAEAYNKTLRAYKAMCKRLVPGLYNTKHVELSMKMFIRAMDGTLNIPLALIHPAKFLHDANSIPSTSSLIATLELFRLSEDSTGFLIQEVCEIHTMAWLLFDLQYFDYYEEATRTCTIPKACIKANPFESGENAVGKMSQLLKTNPNHFRQAGRSKTIVIDMSRCST